MKNERRSCIWVHVFRDLVHGCLVTAFSTCSREEHRGGQCVMLKCLLTAWLSGIREGGPEGGKKGGMEGVQESVPKP